MTRWPRRHRPLPPEVPAWVERFDLADGWLEPDEEELRFGWLPDEARRWHAERRWCEAANRWYREHPAAERRWVEEFLAELQGDWRQP